MTLRLPLVAAGLLLGTACSTLATMEGARTLEPGQAQVGGGLSLQHGASPLSYSGVPIPQVEIAGRVGVAPDVDVGLRAYLLGMGFDTRYRFWQGGRWHLAVAPGLFGAWVPALTGTVAGQGSVELRTPVTAEVVLSDAWSVSFGPRLVLRDQWNSLAVAGGRGAVSRLDVFAGGSARVELRARRLVVGLSGDAFAQPARHGGLGWSAGVDLGFRSAPRSPD